MKRPDPIHPEETDHRPSGAEDFPASRFSKSANASRQAELERLRAMSVMERMTLALSLHQQLQNLHHPNKR